MRSGFDKNKNYWEEISITGKIIDITGKKFNNLTPLFPVRINGKIKWNCLCDCGKEIFVNAAALKNGNTKSCGCLKSNKLKDKWSNAREDLLGSKFNRLTAIRFVGVENNAAIYEFLCDCGNKIITTMHSVKSGNTKSCGCLFDEFIDESKRDIIGKKFGKLTVVSYAGINRYGGTNFKCICDCGREITISRNSLISNNTKSCGCVISIGENNIRKILDKNNIPYKPQWSPPGIKSKNGGCVIYDFAILSNNNVVRLIEFDGEQHNKPFDYFGGENKFLDVKSNDMIKNEYSIKNNIPLIRIPYNKRDNITIEDIITDKYKI